MFCPCKDKNKCGNFIWYSVKYTCIYIHTLDYAKGRKIIIFNKKNFLTFKIINEESAEFLIFLNMFRMWIQ